MNETYMKKALELAKLGVGGVNPNPLVGAIIVKDEKIIGEGYHMKYGELHAERNAFLDCKNKNNDPTGATMYVTLEPCSHHGKTPPCVDAIIENKIKKVVVAVLDKNPIVSGNGIKILKDAGIEVVVGVLEDEAVKINEVFFHFIENKTPFIAMKYAMTLDGKIATKTGESKWISSEKSRNYVQHLRNKYTAIMVGVETVLKDDPMLNCRIENGRNPVRIICDTNLRTPIDSQIVKTSNSIKTIISTNCNDDKKIAEYENLGVIIAKTPLYGNHIDLNLLMKYLGEQKIDSILLEGGGTLNYSSLQMKIVNKVHAFVAPKIFGGSESKTPVMGAGISNINDCFNIKNMQIINGENEDIIIEGDVY